MCVLLGLPACAHVDEKGLEAVATPMKIVVGPVALDAAITKSIQIHSFDESPPAEMEATTLATLLDETQTHAQQVITEQFAQQPRFAVVPFQETRRAQSDIAPLTPAWTHEHLLALGRSTNAEFVMDAHILDYGVVRWQYWVSGWLVHAGIATAIVGLASGWNPAAIGAYLAVDATTDFPLWWGGAQVFGWAFRPVRIQLDILQLAQCEGLVWSQQELIVKVPGKALSGYTSDEQRKREIQLDVNLHKAIDILAENSAETLVQQPCNERGEPQKVGGFSFWSWLDFLY
jgi:hypothetical protein